MKDDANIWNGIVNELYHGSSVCKYRFKCMIPGWRCAAFEYIFRMLRVSVRVPLVQGNMQNCRVNYYKMSISTKGELVQKARGNCSVSTCIPLLFCVRVSWLKFKHGEDW